MSTRTTYVATRLENADEARAIAGALEAHGWRCAYEWWRHGSVQDDGPVRIREVAIAEMQAVARADLVIVRLPGGRGTHVELGIALGHMLGRGVGLKRLIVSAPTEIGFGDAEGRECAFYRHPLAERHVGTVDDLVQFALQVDEARHSDPR